MCIARATLSAVQVKFQIRVASSHRLHRGQRFGREPGATEIRMDNDPGRIDDISQVWLALLINMLGQADGKGLTFEVGQTFCVARLDTDTQRLKCSPEGLRNLFS